ncbi:hypothetical protein [Actinomadura macrotermitis]|uniref:Uncharacterized protein n=1 Tax=Actinomadura macrotermitis TaxID=2585200 RepID=A0A7K0BSW0_9ACTN|nr:hypothetical protein [Actinomadura macrotermitis]MQY03764.1 hypothetical protein [Actinomadura macrotermitis]
MVKLVRRALLALATAALAGAPTTALTAAPALADAAVARTAADYWVRALNSGSGRVTADARCKPGDHVIGGHTVHDAEHGQVIHQGPDSDGAGWSSTVAGDGEFHVVAHAHCAGQ